VLVLGVATEAEVETARTLVVGCLTRRDREAEDRVQGEELESGRALVDQLDERHLDLGESRPGEDGLDVHGSGGGELVGEGAVRHTDVEEERAEGVVLPFVGETEGVNGCDAHAESVKTLGDSLGDGDPGGRTLGTDDGAGLTNDALFLGACAYRPSRARLVDAASLAGVEVDESLRVL
jgi:hypothetical protein